MKRKQYKPTKIWFRKWSRKANAAFLSLGKVVHIGSLGYEMCDKAAGKAKIAGNGHSVDSGVFNSSTNSLIAGPPGVLDDSEEPLLATLMPIFSIPQTQNNLSYPQGDKSWDATAIILHHEVTTSGQDFLFHVIPQHNEQHYQQSF